MKKKVIVIMFSIVLILTDAKIINLKKKNGKSNKIDDSNIKAIYISYLEYINNFCGNSVTINKTKIDKMIDIIDRKKFNAIILHVSPFSDSIYNSKIFPYSHTLTGIEGKNPGFDYLDYFIKKSHSKNITVHAWINPYRISFDSNIENIDIKNPAYELFNSSSVYSDRKGTYYNPASSLVKDLIINQVEEIINNYDVDGIHFDDYFYIKDNIDKVEYNSYKKSGGILSLKEFRLDNTNDLIERVYSKIKSKNKNIIFSIAPDGNINNNYLYHFADVKKWLENNNYVDIIMPQIYYGFKNEYSPFEKVLKSWIELCKNKSIKIVPVLAYYKLGKEDLEAGSGKNEWINDNDIINNQIDIIKKYNLSGFGIFRYDYIVK